MGAPAKKMTTEQRRAIVRAFWVINQGLYGATEGAKAIAAESGIPLNTVRGVQNKMYAPDERPWNLPPVETSEVVDQNETPALGLTTEQTDTRPLNKPKRCPNCGARATTWGEALALFGRRGQYWQSYCVNCR